MTKKQTRLILYPVMILITLVVVFPFLWMLMLSFKSSGEILSDPLAFPTSLCKRPEHAELSPALCQHVPDLRRVADL